MTSRRNHRPAPAPAVPRGGAKRAPLVPILFAVLLSFAGMELRAQGTTPVPLKDLAYRDVDRLAELGMLDSVIIGQRPYSRREFARIARLALERLNRRGNPAALSNADESPFEAASSAAERLEQRFKDDGVEGGFSRYFAPIDGGSIDFNSTDAPRRGFPASHSRVTEATIDPVATERRLGRPPLTGTTFALELSQRAEPASWLGFHARERVEYRTPRDSTRSGQDGEVLLAALRARLGNTTLTVGREQYGWSQRQGDGLFLASDAPALDGFSLASDHPFALPWILRHLGPTQATLIVADLGPSIARSHSRLLTYKVSVQPTGALELGGTFMNHFGGAGGQPSSFGNRLIDFLPFIDIFRSHNYYDSTRTRDVDSDKLLGVDGRLRLSRLGGIVLTGELLIDDFDVRQTQRLLTGYGSSQLAITIPQFVVPALSAVLQAKHMGTITYTHSSLPNGITTRGRLLGDELGPDAKAFLGALHWRPVPSAHLMVEARHAVYSNNEYGARYADKDSVDYAFNKITSGTDEIRDRLSTSVELQGDEALTFVLRGGAERVRNADFASGSRRNYVVEIALRLRQ